ncbi:MAG: energy transducer TonB [Sphingomonas sp.]
MIVKAAWAMTAMLAAGAADVPATPLAPIGPWRVSTEADGGCMVTRSYGAADHPVAVAFRVSPGIWLATVNLLSTDDGRSPARGKAKLITGSGITSEGDFSSVKVPGSEQRLTNFWIDRRAFDGLQAIDTMTLQADVPTVIEIRGATAALAALRECDAKQIVAWGVDPALLGSGASVPVPLNNGPAGWFSSDDYPYGGGPPPSKGQKAPPAGKVTMLVNVGEDGRVKSCRAVASQAPPLDQLSCTLLTRRARYRPVTGADGKPVSSWTTVSLRWGVTTEDPSREARNIWRGN